MYAIEQDRHKATEDSLDFTPNGFGKNIIPKKSGRARVILATAPGSKSISAIINGLGYDGELIVVSAPGEPIQLFPWQLFQGRRAIKGWIASRNETADALNFSVSAKIVPMTEVFPLEQAALAFDKMMASKVRFRSVLKMNN